MVMQTVDRKQNSHNSYGDTWLVFSSMIWWKNTVINSSIVERYLLRYMQVVDAKTGLEINEQADEGGSWVDEYEKFRATEADEWARELAEVSEAQKVFQ